MRGVTTTPNATNQGIRQQIRMLNFSENSTHRTLQFVAIMEAFKGLIVFGAGFGLLTLLHRDVRHVAESLVTRLHIDPERHYAGLFLGAAASVTDTRLWVLAALAIVYSILRGVEAYGLWLDRTWAALLGAAGGAIYIPVEIYELWNKPGPIKAATLTFNVAVVAYLVWALRSGRTKRTPPPAKKLA
jgi:uncharacterized membrane protein (DUF2068 family)